MPDGQVLEFTRVTKRFNDVTAVSDLTARIEPGAVTAFLGPNGAGKTTTLRILLGQVRATSGTATIGGVAFSELRHPLRTIGSVLEETVYRPRRSAARQLTIAAKANGIPLSRVDEVLALVGLGNESEGRIGSFSLGMRQRLSVAHALLGDPGALVFDEPANGLDPEGIRWMRLLMRRLADEGRTVLVSSHVLSEVEQVADNVLVLSKGRLVLSSGIEKLADPASGSVVVDAADRAALTAALTSAGFEIEVLRSGLTVRGGDAGRVGALAASAGIALTTLVQRGPTLEDVFIALVRGGTLAAPAIVAAPEPAAAALEPVADAEVAESAAPDAVAEADAADSAAADADADADVQPADDAAGDVPAHAEAESDAETGAVVDAPESDNAESESPVAGLSFDDILRGTEEAVADSDEESSDDANDDASGVEIFSGLQDSDETTGGTPSADVQEGDADDQGDADPRSAAVSSMLAAAARAYYDDEPRDYPLAGASASAEGESANPSDDGAQSEDGAHFSVASTGVIDQIDESGTHEPERDEQHHEGEHQHDAEHQQDAEQRHDGEQQHEGEHHHDGEQHHGGEHHHEGEHHEGEHQHDGAQHHEGEHHQH